MHMRMSHNTGARHQEQQRSMLANSSAGLASLLSQHCANVVSRLQKQQH
jgi:hypothetical protein